MKPSLAGIVPPMITPLRDRDTLDIEGLERLVEHLIAGGVHGIFLLGTSGEAPNLSYRVRRELIQRVCAQVRSRIPVLVGITDTSIVEALALAQHAADAGAQMAVTSAPFYFPLPQPELRDYVERLVAEVPLPLVLYNMPQMTKTLFAPETVRHLMQNPRIVGIKDSSGDIDCFTRLVEVGRERPGWFTLVGPEHLLVETIRRGGCGGVNGGANIMPRLFVRLYEAAIQGNASLVEELQKQTIALGQLYNIGQSAAAVIQGMKCALSLLGICNDAMTAPFRPLAGDDREKARKILELIPAEKSQ